MLGEKNMTLSNLNDIFELFKENVMGCIMSIILAGVIKFVKNMRKLLFSSVCMKMIKRLMLG